MTHAEFLVVLVAGTSLVALGLGVRVLGLPAGRLRAATLEALEIVGVGLAFFAVNAAVAVTVAILVRGVGGFLSLYLANDVILLFLSLFQGLVFATWRRARRSPTA